MAWTKVSKNGGGGGGGGGVTTPDNTTEGRLPVKQSGAFNNSSLSEDLTDVTSTKPLIVPSVQTARTGEVDDYHTYVTGEVKTFVDNVESEVQNLEGGHRVSGGYGAFETSQVAAFGGGSTTPLVLPTGSGDVVMTLTPNSGSWSFLNNAGRWEYRATLQDATMDYDIAIQPDTNHLAGSITFNVTNGSGVRNHWVLIDVDTGFIVGELDIPTAIALATLNWVGLQPTPSQIFLGTIKYRLIEGVGNLLVPRMYNHNFSVGIPLPLKDPLVSYQFDHPAKGMTPPDIGTAASVQKKGSMFLTGGILATGNESGGANVINNQFIDLPSDPLTVSYSAGFEGGDPVAQGWANSGGVLVNHLGFDPIIHFTHQEDMRRALLESEMDELFANGFRYDVSFIVEGTAGGLHQIAIELYTGNPFGVDGRILVNPTIEPGGLFSLDVDTGTSAPARTEWTTGNLHILSIRGQAGSSIFQVILDNDELNPAIIDLGVTPGNARSRIFHWNNDDTGLINTYILSTSLYAIPNIEVDITLDDALRINHFAIPNVQNSLIFNMPQSLSPIGLRMSWSNNGTRDHIIQFKAPNMGSMGKNRVFTLAAGTSFVAEQGQFPFGNEWSSSNGRTGTTITGGITSIVNDEMLKWDPENEILLGTGDSNTDLVVDFGLKDVKARGESVATIPELNQRQLTRSGLVSNIVVDSVAGDTQVRITPVDATFRAFFNSDGATDSQGVFIDVGQKFFTVPSDVVARKYYIHLLVAGNIGIGTSKTVSEDLTQVHICEFVAHNGVMVTETLIANPFLTWSDKTVQGILDTDGIRVDDLNVSSPDNATMQLQTTDFDILGNSINYAVSKINPHVKKALASNPLAFTYLDQGITVIPPIGADTLIDPDQYDNAGVLTVVPVNQATVQVLMVAADGDFVLLYGQQLFANYDDALLNIDNINFVLPPVLFDAVEVARIAIKQGATDSADTEEITIRNSSGEAGGGSGVAPSTSEFFDTDFKLKNDVDPTKQARFDCVNLQPASLNTFKFPVGEGTLALEEDRDYALVTASKLLTKQDVLEMVDSSGGDISITLPSSPDIGERHVFFIKDNTNVIDVISTDPGAPIGDPVTVQPANLQGQWILDSDFTDSSGKGRDLTAQGIGGGLVANTILGRSVQMYDTQGTNSFVATGYKGIGGATPRTVTMWFASNAGLPASNEAFMSWGENVTGGGVWYQIKTNAGSSRLDAPDLKNANRTYAYTNPAIINLFDGSAHHVALTQSGGNANTSLLYIDGVLISADGGDNSPAANTQLVEDLLIANSITGGQNLDGSLYDVRLWDVALSALEVETVRTENIAGGVNIAALDNNTIIEFAYDGVEWLAATSVFERILDLSQQIAGLAEVARTGSYNDLIDLPPATEGETTGVIVSNTEQWYRMASTQQFETAVINAAFNLTVTEGNHNQSCQFAVTLQNRDSNFGPSFNLISNMNFSSETIIAVRMIADDIVSVNDAFHIDVRIANDANDGTGHFFITEKSPISNMVPVAFTPVADVLPSPARVVGQWQVEDFKQNLNETLRIDKDDFIDYGLIQQSVPKVDVSHLPFSFFSNMQNDTQFTRNNNAVVTLGLVISDAVLSNTGLVQWLHDGAGNGSVKTNYNDAIGASTILDLVQTGINVHAFKLVKQGWYECVLQVNFDDGNDNIVYSATLIRMDSSDTVVEVLGVAEHSDLGRSCNTFVWSGFYDSGDSFALLKTSGTGVNDDLRGRNPRFEIKWIGEV